MLFRSSKMLAHRIGKRRAIRIGILTQEPTDKLDRVLLGQDALDLDWNFHGATINAARENVQHYLWTMGRASYRACASMATFDDRKFARRAKKLGLAPAVILP